MFFGIGINSRTHAAAAPAGGTRAHQRRSVVLVKIKGSTPLPTDSSQQVESASNIGVTNLPAMGSDMGFNVSSPCERRLNTFHCLFTQERFAY